MLIKAEKVREIHGASIVTKGPSISHLCFFTDDSFVFCKANVDKLGESKILWKIIV